MTPGALPSGLSGPDLCGPPAGPSAVGSAAGAALGKLSGAWLGTLATNAAILLCGLATGVLSARLLAPEGRGVLAAVLFWPHLITSLASFSLPAAVISRRARPEVDRARTAATAAWLALGLSLVGALFGLARAAVPAARVGGGAAGPDLPARVHAVQLPGTGPARARPG
jgi:O-antigen/teichoic acid export membrane protein